MLPEVGGVRPPRMLKRVDLPEPEEPTTAMNSPLATWRSTPRRAWTSTSPTRKVLVSCWTLMMGELTGEAVGVALQLVASLPADALAIPIASITLLAVLALLIG